MEIFKGEFSSEKINGVVIVTKDNFGYNIGFEGPVNCKVDLNDEEYMNELDSVVSPLVDPVIEENERLENLVNKLNYHDGDLWKSDYLR